MSSSITDAVYNKLCNDGILTSSLAYGTGSKSIFTFYPVPEDARMPYIVAAGEISVIPNDTKTSRGREIFKDIRVYCSASESTALIETISERVRTLLHKEHITASGYSNTWTEVQNMMDGPYEPGIYSKILTVRFVLRNT